MPVTERAAASGGMSTANCTASVRPRQTSEATGSSIVEPRHAELEVEAVPRPDRRREAPIGAAARLEVELERDRLRLGGFLGHVHEGLHEHRIPGRRDRRCEHRDLDAVGFVRRGIGQRDEPAEQPSGGHESCRDRTECDGDAGPAPRERPFVGPGGWCWSLRRRRLPDRSGRDVVHPQRRRRRIGNRVARNDAGERCVAQPVAKGVRGLRERLWRRLPLLFMADGSATLQLRRESFAREDCAKLGLEAGQAEQGHAPVDHRRVRGAHVHPLDERQPLRDGAPDPLPAIERQEVAAAVVRVQAQQPARELPRSDRLPCEVGGNRADGEREPTQPVGGVRRRHLGDASPAATAFQAGRSAHGLPCGVRSGT